MKPGPKIFYLRNKHGHRVACVASELDGDLLRFAVSSHNPKDKFSKDVARRVAVGRLQARRCFELRLGQAHGTTVKAKILEIIADACRCTEGRPGTPFHHRLACYHWAGPGFTDRTNVPHRAREAARLWLAQHEKEGAGRCA